MATLIHIFFDQQSKLKSYSIGIDNDKNQINVHIWENGTIECLALFVQNNHLSEC